MDPWTILGCMNIHKSLWISMRTEGRLDFDPWSHGPFNYWDFALHFATFATRWNMSFEAGDQQSTKTLQWTQMGDSNVPTGFCPSIGLHTGIPHQRNPWFCISPWVVADPLALFSKAGTSWPALPCRMFLCTWGIWGTRRGARPTRPSQVVNWMCSCCMGSEYETNRLRGLSKRVNKKKQLRFEVPPVPTASDMTSKPLQLMCMM